MNSPCLAAEKGTKSAPTATKTLRQAVQALRMGDGDRAVALANEILVSDDTHAGALETLARAQWQLGLYDELLGTLGRLIRLNPYEPGYHALKGATLRSLGRHGEAIRSFVRGGTTPGASEALEELRAMQADLVQNLLREDPVFRAHYTHNPEEACEERGFEFGSESKIRQLVLSDAASRATLLTRPS
ncbi:MAG TPA: BTAD domain-containing putative transcriptional regulator [Fimbriimonadaceae bacterium]|nr:BTAD domain-containing putative transcriptional regulator [Fimbriimonadaceae bacterium]